MDPSLHVSSSSSSSSSLLQQQQQKPFLIIGTIPIYFQEDWNTGIGGGLWSTGLAMAQYLQDFGANHHVMLDNLQRLYEQNQQQPLSFLELGSGHGLLALCWVALLTTHQKLHWMDHLVITDTKEHLPLIQRTLDANSHFIHSNESSSGDDDDKVVVSTTKITVMDHSWGVFETSNQDETTATCDNTITSNDKTSSDISIETLVRQGRFQFDLIFGSDLAYHPHLYQPLLTSLQVLLSKTNRASIVLIGCTMKDTTPAFFDQARAVGFRYERLSEHLLRPEFRNNFGIFCLQKTKIL